VARITWGLAGLGTTVGVGVTVTVEGGGAGRVVVTVGVDTVPQLVIIRTTPINTNIDINDNNILFFIKNNPFSFAFSKRSNKKAPR
jgi:hypothetical protein